GNEQVTRFSFPNSVRERTSAKLCFVPTFETEFREAGSQTQFGNQDEKRRGDGDGANPAAAPHAPGLPETPGQAANDRRVRSARCEVAGGLERLRCRCWHLF